MCGLFGFSKLNERTRDMARFLAYAMVYRGDDSWGASNGVDVIKELGPITNDFHIPLGWKEGIFHTRGASVGAVTQHNAHPFVVKHDGRRVIGIHNGGVRNYEELNNRYQRKCEVDSEHIFYHLAERRNLGELFGAGTIVWYDIYHERQTIHLARWNYGDLVIARLKDNNGIVFCSTKDPIILSAAMSGLKIDSFYQTIMEGFWHVIEPRNDGDDVLAKGQSLGFDNYRRGNYNRHNYNEISRSPANQMLKQCRRCHVVPVSKSVLCDNCWKALRVNHEAELEAKAKRDLVVHVPNFAEVN